MAVAKGIRIARTRGVTHLVRVARHKLAYPTLPADVLATGVGEHLSFEQRWVLRGAGLTRSHSTTIIILTRGAQTLLEACIKSLARSILPDARVEILVVNNGGPIRVPTEWPFPLRFLRETRQFNWSSYNNRAVANATGEFLLFMNDDVQALHGGWLDAMLAEAIQPQTGVVGAKLLYPDGRIQHHGTVIEGGGLRDLHKFLARDDPAVIGACDEVTEVDAVLGACLLTPKSVFEQHKFDERFALSYNDVDYCLRVKQSGMRVVVTPYAELVHLETSTRSLRIPTQEVQLMSKKWGTPPI
jgi:GT2 family glycosyltransferase